MRFINTLMNDIRYQIKYGFYFLYAFFSGVYITVLILTPQEYKNMVGALIILTDPAMLGIFFIGGIWLLEKGEGLHRFWSISPLRTIEYLMAKSVSLAFLSAISAGLIVLIGLGPGSGVNLVLLTVSTLIGAVVFNIIGLIAASYARSVNHYVIIAAIPSFLLSIPPVLTAFGIVHPLLEIFPGTALLHMIVNSIDTTGKINVLPGAVLIFWLIILIFTGNKRIGAALQPEGGEGA